MKFVLSIELGNDAMNFGYEVAEALEAAGKDLREAHESNRGHDVKHWDKFDQSHIIRDCNGNTVGKWEAIEPAGIV